MFDKKEVGRSMIEMLGVLAVIGILSAGGIAGYTMAMKNYRADKAMEKFQLASTEIITAFGENSDFSKLSNADNVKKLKLDLESPYNGNISVNGDNGYFWLIMNNVPEQACLKITQATWGDDYAFGSSANDTTYTNNSFACNGDDISLVLTYKPGISSSLDNSACEQCMSTCMTPGSILVRCLALCGCN